MSKFSFFLDAAREFFTFLRFETNPALLDQGVTAIVLVGKGEGFLYTPANDALIGGVISQLHYTVNFEIETASGTVEQKSHTFLEWHGLSEDLSTGGMSLDDRIDLATAGTSLAELVLSNTPIEGGGEISPPASVEVYFGDNSQKQNTAFGSPDGDIFVLANTGRSDLGQGDDLASASGVTNATQVFLRRGNDVYIGEQDAVELEPGTAGLKSVYAGLGNDLLRGGGTTDEMRGNRGNDYLNGYGDDDRLFGGAGDDFIFGGAGDDQIFGGVGRDVVQGGAGSDGLRGGLGQDVFWFELADADPDAAVVEQDVIYDFNQGIDYLHVTSSDGSDLTRRDAWAIFQENSVQRGADTEFTYAGTKVILRDTDVQDFRLSSFYDKPWLLENAENSFDSGSELHIFA